MVIIRQLLRHLTFPLIVGQESCKVVWSVRLLGVLEQSGPQVVCHLAERVLTRFYLSDICFNMGQKMLLRGQVEILLTLSVAEGRE